MAPSLIQAHFAVTKKTAKGYFKNVKEQVFRRHSKVGSNL